jgi:hypothetical protein
MVDIPFPVATTKDSPERAGSGKLINAILEQIPDGRVIRKRAPGVAQFATSASGASHCRGMLLANENEVLVAYDGALEVVNAIGGSTYLGVLSGAGLATMARNLKAPTPDIVIVANNIAYVANTTGPPAPYPDLTIGNPNSVCYGDGYFFFTYLSGECQASAINDTTLDPLDAIQVNSSSSSLLRGVYYAQTLYLFTEDTTEAWTNTANPTGFPFSRSAVIPRGLLSPFAVAGFEAKFTSSLLFVGSDSIVYLMNGYSPVRVSNSDIERRISSVADKSTLRASVHVSEGHAIWQLTSSDFTLCFDVTNTYWFERKSEGSEFSRMECSVYAFGGWLVGDRSTGVVGRVSANAFSEYGATLTWAVQSLPVDKFPSYTIVRRADFNFVVGIGLDPPHEPLDLVTDYASDPQISVSWSDDGGATFNMPVLRALGKVGRDIQSITVLRSGQSTRYGRVWRVEVSDPCYVGLLSANMEMR